MKRPFFLICLLSFSFVNLVFAETILTNTEGKDISVHLIKADKEKVWFSIKKGSKAMAYDLDKLDEKSRETIENWVKGGGMASDNMEVLFFPGKRNRSDEGEDFDDREYKFKSKIRIENKDLKLDTAAGKAYVLFLGKPVRYRGKNCMVARQEINISALKPLQEKEFLGQSFSFKYDDKDNGEIYGAHYRGYVLIIKNEAGTVMYTKAIPKSLLDAGPEKLLNLEVGAVYDKNWNKEDAARVRLQ